MPSASPSPGKRPSINERTSSAQSLSSSGKPAAGQKPPRPHYVSRHSRNVSHGKGLSKLGRVNSSANVHGEGRNHQRKKSGPTTPSVSPKANSSGLIKRNSSHVVLPKNTSHSNLRKNHSSAALTAINRNMSHGALKKLGAPPSQKLQQQDHKQGVFDLGDQSSEEDEEEWEDSTTQSPEITRNNSKASTPARVRTPNGEPIRRLPEPPRSVVPERTSSPPEPSPLKANNRSAPNLRHSNLVFSAQATPDSNNQHRNERSSRAPPAVSTATARADSGQTKITDSSRDSKRGSLQSARTLSESADLPGPGQSSSGSAGVSHFLNPESASGVTASTQDDSDGDAPSAFMSNYKPQAAESPESARNMLNKARVPSVPSRTQQRLELQRREVLRGAPAATNAPPAPGMGVSASSTVSLHTRSGSKGRSRALAGETKLIKQDYEAAIKQLMVVRRFRNPILESLNRLKDADALPAEVGATTPGGPTSRSKLKPKKGVSASGTTNETLRTPAGGSPEDKRSSAHASRSSSQARGSKVHFQMSRHDSHDDMLTASQGSPETRQDETDGVSAEEALIRRMWESRVEVGA